MSERNTVLAILELDAHPDRLVDRAIWLARTFECDLHLMLFVPETENVAHVISDPDDELGLLAEIRRAEDSIAERYSNTVRDAGIAVETSIFRARPLADYALELADRLTPRIVVKAAEYHTTAERSVLVDADWQLMRTCPFPLWLVKSDAMPDAPAITAAVDPGHANDKPGALDKEIALAANCIADKTGGEVELVHAYELLADLGTAATWAINARKLDVDQIEAAMTASHRDALNGIAGEHNIDVARAHLVPGRAHEVLPAFARKHGTNVFVMGALSRWGFKKRILGSTAERIIDQLPCDTLIVRIGEYPLGE